jgi:hypothetical protein
MDGCVKTSTLDVITRDPPSVCSRLRATTRDVEAIHHRIGRLHQLVRVFINQIPKHSSSHSTLNSTTPFNQRTEKRLFGVRVMRDLSLVVMSYLLMNLSTVKTSVGLMQTMINT